MSSPTSTLLPISPASSIPSSPQPNNPHSPTIPLLSEVTPDSPHYLAATPSFNDEDGINLGPRFTWATYNIYNGNHHTATNLPIPEEVKNLSDPHQETYHHY